jgi:GNAT superfamily N-acetyltransferase
MVSKSLGCTYEGMKNLCSETQKIRISQPKTTEDFDKYYDLRWRILRKPWNQPKGSQRDEYEEEAIHVMACLNDKVIAVGRAHFNSSDEAQIRYMAVESSFQGRGVGSLILRELERRAKEEGAQHMILNGRENAIGFYQKNGYEIIDKGPTLFGCISQWKMRKELT